MQASFVGFFHRLIGSLVLKGAHRQATSNDALNWSH